MTHPNQNEILEKIKSLEDKLWDAVSYISSDFCKQCSSMYDKINIYEKEIAELKNQLNHERNRQS